MENNKQHLITKKVHEIEKNQLNDKSATLNNEFLLKLKKDSNKNDLNEFVCGWSAAFVNILITFPINKIMFRQMAYGVRAKSAVNQFKDTNLLYIYRGLVPPLISTNNFRYANSFIN